MTLISEVAFEQNVKNRRKHRSLKDNMAELAYITGDLVCVFPLTLQFGAREKKRPLFIEYSCKTEIVLRK